MPQKSNKSNKKPSANSGAIDYSHLLNLRTEIKSALKKSRTNMTRAALIKFFELAFEQSWKILKKVLMKDYSIETLGSKDTFREAARLGLIQNPENWFKFVDDRNETVHSYDQAVADEIIADMDEFIEELDYLVTKLQKLK